jgi:hydrogenase maturation protein HypF
VRSSNTKHKQQGVEILVQGTVQGVGFRPFIYNLASRLRISGTVTNTGDGVVIKALSEHERLHSFIAAITAEAPPLARITSVQTRELDPKGYDEGFFIISSVAGSSATTAIPPDIALCDDCLKEFLDPTDNRFHYPFINCTNCGPRFTIVETIPYDRPKTSMKVFPMCDDCAAEYHDPGNRRFHAQPNACPRCGPGVTLHAHDGRSLPATDPVETAATLLGEGRVLAMRGLGGFHLVVDGCSEEAVALLRLRKGRPDKPLAIMVATLALADEICEINATEKALLTSPERPIVLLGKKDHADLAANLAPGVAEIGVMLPYTPLHHLLFQMNDCPKVLVMTSGNISGAPICTGNDDALARLGPIADFFLLHNREIVTRVDDSVAKVVGGNPLILRRARGFVPSPVMVGWQLPNIIGCGAGLKSTFSLGRGRSVFTSQHIGDLDSLPSYDFYLESIEHLKSVLRLEPIAVACDLHPDYLSSRYGAEMGLPLYKVQHHHAHAVAVMAEHGLEGAALAVVLDGTGLGEDGTIWGGEILLADPTGFRRLGHLSHLLLPGGDAANSEPWRMGLSALYQTFGPEGLAAGRLPPALAQLDRAKVDTIAAMLASGFHAPPSSSCGRLFDAVASLLGLRQKISYEGQAAMELETLAKRARTRSWLTQLSPKSHTDISRFLVESGGKWEISSPEFVKLVTDGMARADSPSHIALRFHSLLIASITKLIENLAHQTGIRQIVLSGGCMQNSLLLEGLFHTLNEIHLQVFTGNLLPVNDGAVSFGQTIIGGLRHVSRNSHEGNQRPG